MDRKSKTQNFVPLYFLTTGLSDNKYGYDSAMEGVIYSKRENASKKKCKKIVQKKLV